MLPNQEQVDAFFKISPESRIEMSQGRVPLEIREREHALGPSRAKVVVWAVCAAPILGLLASGGRASMLGGVAGLLLLVVVVALEARARRNQRRHELALEPIEVTEGHAETVRYWFPTYGEVSRLCADLVVSGRRHVLPPSFEDFVVTGPVRVFSPNRGHGEQTPRSVALGLELLAGSSLYRRAPTRKPPSDFLQIQPADESEEPDHEER